MRLHHLSVTAFGPFVEPAEVDFDALSDAGLFLLSGATGSGKSSVLDAVCFALYGAVPGDRQDAGRLRSDQAPPGLMPQISLDVSLSGRRFRVVRSPAWERPKKRGSGTTREQARVTVSERSGTAWVHLTSRLDEAGDLLAGLLGMNLDQFCQVALLPQGHFQAFLRAKPDERQRLLARLFRTGRFERVEVWLRDHRLALRRRSEGHAQTVGDLVSRLSEAAHRPVPEACVDLASAADRELLAWASDVRAEASSRRTSTAAEVEEAAAARATTAAALAAARDLASSRSRVVAAAEIVERLDSESEHHATEVARLDRARRAQGLLPLARLVEGRTGACAAAERRAAASQATATRHGVRIEAAPAELERSAQELATLMALLPAEQQLEDLREQQAGHEKRLAELSREDELSTAEVASLSPLEGELKEAVAAAEAAALTLPVHEADVERLRRVTAAHDDVARLTGQLRAAAGEHEEARRAVVDLRTHLLDLRERRIAGMAAELAGGLVVGGDCPVCGSAEHPRPAHPAAERADADAEHAAQRAVDDAQAVELAQRLRVRDLEASLASARETAGDTDPAGARDQLSAVEAALLDVRSRLAEADILRERLAETSARIAALAEDAAARRLSAVELSTTAAHLEARVTELGTQVAAARGDHPKLRAAVATLTERRDLLRAVRDDATAFEAARDSLGEATTALGRAVVEAGFETADEARAAVLSADEMAALEQSVQDHRTALAAARQVLEEPEAWALLTTPAPDVPGAEERARVCAEALELCRAADGVASRTDDRVRRLTDELTAALAAWAPVRSELAVATSVSAFAEGKAPDNRLQMRLSAYVLAFRLSQVVAAANARLAGMSDQRYALEHVARRGAGESRGGLSLVVRDAWSGESRDPATLSGGETFVVSLALALGLADVVSHEAGDADLQTLFVDEGFGSLDAETLDDVLDILDSLRENGRTVGVVSHVAEMRHRIPTQLVVSKARTGSSLQVVGSRY
jgi:exonuclease SbcC